MRAVEGMRRGDAMNVTTEQLIEDLYNCTQLLRHRWNRDDNRQRAEILIRLEDARGWKGRTNRYLRVPSQPHILLHLQRTAHYGVVANFEDLESPLGLGCHEEWREEVESAECENCSALLELGVSGLCLPCAEHLARMGAAYERSRGVPLYRPIADPCNVCEPNACQCAAFLQIVPESLDDLKAAWLAQANRVAG